MKKPESIICFLILFSCFLFAGAFEASGNDTLYIKKSNDFQITGDKTSGNWDKAEWIPLTQRRQTDILQSTQVKILYSETGLYFLFSCEDSILTATMNVDNMQLWKEDVVEIFLVPDMQSENHFEYELSPLNYELALFVTYNNNSMMRLTPYYVDEKESERIQHKTAIRNGEKRSQASVKGWTAECFIPFRFLELCGSITPYSGMQWKGNLYRVDYDRDKPVSWTWTPVTGSYHNTKEYGIFIFE